MLIYQKLNTSLYYGTIFEIAHVDVNAERNGRDFGKGFYMVAQRAQAIEMMHKNYREKLARRGEILHESGDTKSKHPTGLKRQSVLKEHLYEIALDAEALEGLNIKHFTSADYEWLDFVLMCRNKDGLPHNYDMVVGATADDDTAVCMMVYKRGAYGEIGSPQAKQTLLRNLKTENLGIQYFIGKQNVADTVIKSIHEIDWR